MKMSVSSRTSPASILKKSKHLRNRLSELSQTPTKVRFKLPHAQKVRNILENYLETKVSRDYGNLLCLIRDGELTDDDVSALLKEATECISILSQELRLFVEVLLSVKWIDKRESVVKEYQGFVVNLLSAHNYHARMVIDRLVQLFLPNPSEPDWPEGIPTDEDHLKLSNVHTLLNELVTVMPMCKELLMASITNQFPYYNKSSHIHEYYVHNLLWILEYQPKFRRDVLHLILSKLVILDVNAPREEIQKFAEDEDIFPMDDTKSVKSLKSSTTAFTQVNRLVVADTLDICLDKLFKYIIDECHDSASGELDWDKLKKLYHELFPIFDKVILPTYDTHHVQYVMFLMCCLKSTVSEAFLNQLWKKVCNPNEPRILRQAAVNYMASLLARANFITMSLLKSILTQLAEWIHMYISNQDGLEC
nr:unnamed protein product [Callosobruchus analis]